MQVILKVPILCWWYLLSYIYHSKHGMFADDLALQEEVASYVPLASDCEFSINRKISLYDISTWFSNSDGMKLSC